MIEQYMTLSRGKSYYARKDLVGSVVSDIRYISVSISIMLLVMYFNSVSIVVCSVSLFQFQLNKYFSFNFVLQEFPF